MKKGFDLLHDPSLVFYKDLRKNDGNTFKSDDRYGYTLTNVGSVISSRGRVFDEVDDTITASAVSTNSLNFITEDFTVIMWANFSNWSNGYCIQRALPNTDGWEMQVDGAGGLRFFTNQSGAQQVTISSTVAKNTMYHIALTRIKSVATIYCDLVDITANHGTHIDPVTASRIFSLMPGNQGGTLGEVSIFSRFVTPLERQNHYNATRKLYKW